MKRPKSTTRIPASGPGISTSEILDFGFWILDYGRREVQAIWLGGKRQRASPVLVFRQPSKIQNPKSKIARPVAEAFFNVENAAGWLPNFGLSSSLFARKISAHSLLALSKGESLRCHGIHLDFLNRDPC